MLNNGEAHLQTKLTLNRRRSPTKVA